MKEVEPIAFVVDDDQSVRVAVKRLVASIGVRVEAFATAREFLQFKRPDAPSCLILDVCMPDLSGLDLQRLLAEKNIHIPIIFLTNYGDIPMSVSALKAGAVDFLTKPFRNQDLLEAVRQGITKDSKLWQEQGEIAGLQSRYESLSRRERDVLQLVVEGRLNKQIASELGTSEVTVKVHRSQMMQKMAADSVASLVKMVEKLNHYLPSH
jgi:FixJ family two-component response regulator